MANAALVRTKENRLLCLYHAPEAGVCVRGYENGIWGKPRTVLSGARDAFTVNMADDGRLYVFAQDIKGNMHLCTSNAAAPDGWNDQTILRSQMSASQSAYFHALISEAGLHLIYNVPTGEGRGQQLVSQRLGADGRWGVANRLGGVSAIGGQPVRSQMVGRGHMILLYQTCEPDCSLGYREVAPDRIGGMHTIHTTGYQITDASFLATGEVLHVLYIVKSPFSCQLIYRRRDGAGFSDPVVVWEAQRIDSCILYIAEGRLTVCCICNGQPFSCAAGANGAFSHPVRVRASFGSEPMKAVYLSEVPMEAGAFFCRELYVEKVRPWEVQLLGIPSAVFYPIRIQLDLPAPPTPVVEQEPERMENYAAERSQTAEMMMAMRARVEKAAREGAEKDMRIMALEARMRAMEAERFAAEARLGERTDMPEAVAEKKLEVASAEEVALQEEAEPGLEVKAGSEEEAE